MKINCSFDKMVPIENLVPNPKNNNRHPIEQIEQFVKILNFQGIRRPIVVSNRSGFVIKGHGLLDACKTSGLQEVPVNYQDYESEAQEFADMTADNELARQSELDRHQLFTDLQDMEFDLDLDLLGMEDFDRIPEKNKGVSGTRRKDHSKGNICKEGQTWWLGDNQITVGQSILEAEQVIKAWQTRNGREAVLVSTGETFNTLVDNYHMPE